MHPMCGNDVVHSWLRCLCFTLKSSQRKSLHQGQTLNTHAWITNHEGSFNRYIKEEPYHLLLPSIFFFYPVFFSTQPWPAPQFSTMDSKGTRSWVELRLVEKKMGAGEHFRGERGDHITWWLLWVTGRRERRRGKFFSRATSWQP